MHGKLVSRIQIKSLLIIFRCFCLLTALKVEGSQLEGSSRGGGTIEEEGEGWNVQLEK